MVLYEIFTVGRFTSRVNVPSALLLYITAPLSVSFILLFLSQLKDMTETIQSSVAEDFN